MFVNYLNYGVYNENEITVNYAPKYRRVDN